MRKILLTIGGSLLLALSGVGLSFAQDGSDVPDLVPIEMSVCSYKDGKDSDDLDKANAMMRKWMDDSDAEPFAAFQLDPLFAGNQEFDYVSIGVWANGTSMGKDMTQWMASAADERAAFDDAVDCGGSTMFTSLNVMDPGEGTGTFVLTVTDCTVADGRSTRDAVGALREYGEYRNATGSPGGMWVWFPTYGDGNADFDFKMAASYASVEAFGNNFQWNRDNQAYMKRTELFSGLLDCNVARSYNGSTIVNTIPDN